MLFHDYVILVVFNRENVCSSDEIRPVESESESESVSPQMVPGECVSRDGRAKPRLHRSWRGFCFTMIVFLSSNFQKNF